MTPAIELQVVGWARTPWRRRQDAPHQPVASPESEGVLEIEPPYRPALQDLGTFGRIWLVFAFHESRGWAATVKPPRGGPKRGVFATRAPNRPSQIGLSSVTVVGVDVDAGLVRVQGIDLLDGTPLLDLKPYVPSIDAWPDAGHGWLEPYLGVQPRLKKPYKPPRD